jgi:hypothetical protein
MAPSLRAAATGLLVLAFVGCGGGDDAASTGVADEQPTKREYLARGDAICADAQADLARMQPKIEAASAAESEDEQARLSGQVWREQLRILESFGGRIKALGAPRGDEEQVSEFVRSLDEAKALGDKVVARLEDGKDPSQDLIEEYARTAYRGNELARAYGFKVCGRTE